MSDHFDASFCSSIPSQCLATLTGLAVLGLMTFSTPTLAQPETVFERYEISLPAGPTTTVLTGYVLDAERANILVLSPHIDGQTQLRVHALDAADPAPAIDTRLGREIEFVDIMRISGRDRLIAYQDGQIALLELETGGEHVLAAITTNLQRRADGSIPHVDIGRDVSGDGLDDLVIPRAEGFAVSVQLAEGGFAEPVIIGPGFETATLARVHGYRLDPWSNSRIHETDFDRDGRTDLVFWTGEALAIHLQLANGHFDPEPVLQPLNIAFDSDRMRDLVGPDEIREREKDEGLDGRLNGRILHAVRDLDGDSVTDLGFYVLSGDGLLSLEAQYEVHLGQIDANHDLDFAERPAVMMRSRGIPFNLDLRDLNGDGRAELVHTKLRPAFVTIFAALLTRTINLHAEVYSLYPDRDPERPDAVQVTTMDSLGETNRTVAVFPTFLIGNVTGDTAPDLITGRRGRELRIYPGETNGSWFARRPLRTPHGLPHDGALSWLADLNGDARNDLVMHLHATGSSRVVALVAR
jgi:hypothetical protein